MTDLGNHDVEQDLEALPDQVAQALEHWRTTTLEREKMEALLYAQYRGEDPESMIADVKQKVKANELRYESVLNEIKAEAEYKRLLEKLLAAKKKASLRMAY